jgi:hypothetical protein
MQKRGFDILSRTKKLGHLRAVAVLIILTFTAQEFSYANPELGTLTPPHAVPVASLSEVIQNPSKLDVPFDFATLKEFHAGTNGKLIIHIQDAHSNYSGQMSLAKTLDRFMSIYDQNLVLTEGASKDVTLTPLKSLADKKNWNIVARRFLQDGVIAGVEYLNLTSDHSIHIRGVEYQHLYNEALKTYAELVDKRKQILIYLHTIRVSMDRLKAKLYPQALLDYERKTRDGSGQAGDATVQFDNLIPLLEPAKVDLTNFEEVSTLKSLKEIEKTISFDKASLEQERLLGELSSKGLKEKVDEYLRGTKKTKNLQASQNALLNRLFGLAEANGIQSQDFPELGKCREYLKSFGSLDMERLMKQVELLEDAVYKNLLPAEEGRKLRAVDRFVGLLDKAYRIQMSSSDFKMFAANKDDFKTPVWQAYLNEELVKLSYFEDLVPFKPYFEQAAEPLFHFYKLVDERDNAFLENTERIMTEEKAQMGYLVAGGYHTEHLMRIFKDKGYSVVVLTPVVEFETDQTLYEKMLLMPFKFAARQKEMEEKGKKLAKTSEQNILKTTLMPELIGNSPAAASRLASEVDLGARLPVRLNEVLARISTAGIRNNESSSAIGARMASVEIIGDISNIEFKEPEDSQALLEKIKDWKYISASLKLIYGIDVGEGQALRLELGRSIGEGKNKIFLNTVVQLDGKKYPLGFLIGNLPEEEVGIKIKFADRGIGPKVGSFYPFTQADSEKETKRRGILTIEPIEGETILSKAEKDNDWFFAYEKGIEAHVMAWQILSGKIPHDLSFSNIMIDRASGSIKIIDNEPQELKESVPVMMIYSLIFYYKSEFEETELDRLLRIYIEKAYTILESEDALKFLKSEAEKFKESIAQFSGYPYYKDMQLFEKKLNDVMDRLNEGAAPSAYFGSMQILEKNGKKEELSEAVLDKNGIEIFDIGPRYQVTSKVTSYVPNKSNGARLADKSNLLRRFGVGAIMTAVAMVLVGTAKDSEQYSMPAGLSESYPTMRQFQAAFTGPESAKSAIMVVPLASSQMLDATGRPSQFNTDVTMGLADRSVEQATRQFNGLMEHAASLSVVIAYQDVLAKPFGDAWDKANASFNHDGATIHVHVRTFSGNPQITDPNAYHVFFVDAKQFGSDEIKVMPGYTVIPVRQANDGSVFNPGLLNMLAVNYAESGKLQKASDAMRFGDRMIVRLAYGKTPTHQALMYMSVFPGQEAAPILVQFSIPAGMTVEAALKQAELIAKTIDWAA